MFQLLEIIEKARIKLTDVPLSKVNPDNPKDMNNVKGKIAETMVEEWLARTGIIFDTEFPRRVNGYLIAPKNGNKRSNILVMEGTRQILEYDFLMLYQKRPVPVEVKSNKLKGIESKIPFALDLTREIYQKKDITMLLFFPMYTNKKKDAERIEANHPDVACIDLGYKKKWLNNTVERFYEEWALRN